MLIKSRLLKKPLILNPESECVCILNKSLSLALSLAPNRTMVSLSNQTSFSFYPNNRFVPEKTRLGAAGLNFPRKIKVKVTCFAADQPRQQQQKKKKSQSQSTTSDAESGVNPVGFLTKLGIADRIFAQFLRERFKIKKNLNFDHKMVEERVQKL